MILSCPAIRSYKRIQVWKFTKLSCLVSKVTEIKIISKVTEAFVITWSCIMYIDKAAASRYQFGIVQSRKQNQKKTRATKQQMGHKLQLLEPSS